MLSELHLRRWKESRRIQLPFFRYLISSCPTWAWNPGLDIYYHSRVWSNTSERVLCSSRPQRSRNRTIHIARPIWSTTFSDLSSSITGNSFTNCFVEETHAVLASNCCLYISVLLLMIDLKKYLVVSACNASSALNLSFMKLYKSVTYKWGHCLEVPPLRHANKG